MTDQNQPAANRTARRVNKTPAWKSALLASAMGTVLLGWGLLGCSDATSNTSTQQNTSTSPASDVLVSDGTDEPSDSTGSITIPGMPQAPVFRQAPARTRGS
jgi:hypothetical protein